MLCNIWCWFRLPETKDRTFGEIDILFENHLPARKFKHTKVDRKSFPFLVLRRDSMLHLYMQIDGLKLMGNR